MTRIVTTTYRYKRPPRKRKPAGIGGPAVVTTRSVGNRQKPPPVEDEPEPAVPPPANHDGPTEPAPLPAASAIATALRPGKRLADALDLTPEELQRRGEAAASDRQGKQPDEMHWPNSAPAVTYGLSYGIPHDPAEAGSSARGKSKGCSYAQDRLRPTKVRMLGETTSGLTRPMR